MKIIVLYSQPHVASHSGLTTLFKQEEDLEERPLAEICADLAENSGLKSTSDSCISLFKNKGPMAGVEAPLSVARTGGFYALVKVCCRFDDT